MIKVRGGVAFDPKRWFESCDEIDLPVPIDRKEHDELTKKLAAASEEIKALQAKIQQYEARS